jgi:hypothetical protein
MTDDDPTHPLVEELWPRVDEKRARHLERELHAELGVEHPLAEQELRALGAASGTDDVLFAMATADGRVLVEVHLTWSRHPEPLGFPTFRVFTSLEALIEYARTLCAPPYRFARDDAYDPKRMGGEGA